MTAKADWSTYRPQPCRTTRGEELDTIDSTIYKERTDALARERSPMVGDYVEFSDGVVRRISHDWGDSVQTSDGGSWYLGNGYLSFSGSLYPSVAKSALADTGTLREGHAWFFHHDWRTAHNGIDVLVNLRVWAASVEAPK